MQQYMLNWRDSREQQLSSDPGITLTLGINQGTIIHGPLSLQTFSLFIRQKPCVPNAIKYQVSMYEAHPTQDGQFLYRHQPIKEAQQQTA
jgi:hypothetical protein